MMSVIGLINTSMHAFSSMVGFGSGSQDLIGDDMIIFLTSVVVAGSNDASWKFCCGESAWTCESWLYNANVVFKWLEKKLHNDLIDAWVGREGAGRLCKILLMYSHSFFDVAEFVDTMFSK